MAMEFSNEYIENCLKNISAPLKLAKSELDKHENHDENLELFNSEPFQNLKNIYMEMKNNEYDQILLKIIMFMAYLDTEHITKEIYLELIKDEKEIEMIIPLLHKEELMNIQVQQVLRIILENINTDGISDENIILNNLLSVLIHNIVDYKSALKSFPHVIFIWKFAYKYEDLIERYILNVNVDEEQYTTYFHLIVEGSTYEVVDTIIQKIETEKHYILKKVFNAKDKNKGVVLHNAAVNRDERIISLLIKKGANIEKAKKKYGWTPLHLAAKEGHFENVKVLLENGSKINAKTGYRFTPLHLAAQNGYAKIVKILLDYGADVNAEDSHQFTPLHFAAKNNHFEVIETLLNNKEINVNAVTDYQLTPLHFAAKAGYLDSVQLLLNKGADVNIVDHGKFTPLHSAAAYNHVEVVKTLLNKGKEIEIRTKTTKGNTPLHLAAEQGYLEIVKALIARNADVFDKNEDSRMPSDLAAEKNHTEVKEYIIQHFSLNNTLVSSF